LGLDVLIADKVFGCKPKRGPDDDYHCTCPSNPFLGAPHAEAEEDDDSNIPTTNLLMYSTHISAAWQVVEKMQANDWAVIIDNMKDSLGNWQVQFEKNENAKSCEAGTAPHAICLAALKAVGYDGR
jgi:hypothetical protein